MVTKIDIQNLIENNTVLTKISDDIYKVDNEVIEVLDVNYDLKEIKIRHNHSTHLLQFKNRLDLTLDKMGIKRTFESLNTDIKAPMPGKVIDVMIQIGDKIEKNQPLLILEAMKMENVLKSEGDAVIKNVHISKSENVESGQLLIELEPAEK